MVGPVQRFLPDGRRLHLQHGPIDLIVEAFGADRGRALEQAAARFETILDDLADELPLLRAPLGRDWPTGPVAHRMARAVAPFADVFITPMAAVAGAVADEVLAAMTDGCLLERAYVNNGGDIAVYLGLGQSLIASIQVGGDAEGRDTESCDAGRVRLDARQSARGLATSGWRGRSHSLGIADAVTVVGENAAAADAAATLIANAVDLPGHAMISRQPASELAPDSDLGDRLVTVGVGDLSVADVRQALDAGATVARAMITRQQIAGAALFLSRQSHLAGRIIALGQQPDEDADARFQIA